MGETTAAAATTVLNSLHQHQVILYLNNDWGKTPLSKDPVSLLIYFLQKKIYIISTALVLKVNRFGYLTIIKTKWLLVKTQ